MIFLELNSRLFDTRLNCNYNYAKVVLHNLLDLSQSIPICNSLNKRFN